MANLFLSTPSARRATLQRARSHIPACNFYPRPPRGGRRPRAREGIEPKNFYPRPPRGGRHVAAFLFAGNRRFLSTPSARRATFTAHKALCFDPKFLSTPSARRATRPPDDRQAAARFLSTPSARRATSLCFAASFLHRFLSTPSARRATRRQRRSKRLTGNFYPRPPRGGRLR